MPKQWSTPPAMQIDPKKKYKAHMETDKGTMVIELFADKPPTPSTALFSCVVKDSTTVSFFTV
jgi:hypothetical protein